MKNIVLILFTFLLYACGQTREEQAQMEKDNYVKIYPLNKADIEIYTYQGCNYIVCGYPTDRTWGAHMGNCPNPIHKLIKSDSLITK